MPQNRRKSRGGSAPLTPKQKQAAIVLGICALVLIITIVVVSVIVSKAGGGKPDSAMGGGKDILKLDDALASVDDFISEKIK